MITTNFKYNDVDLSNILMTTTVATGNITYGNLILNGTSSLILQPINGLKSRSNTVGYIANGVDISGCAYYRDFTTYIASPSAIAIPTGCTEMRVLLIGGGGGGGLLAFSGAGGGGGTSGFSYITINSTTVTNYNTYTHYRVSVGIGGLIPINTSTNPTSGGTSTVELYNGTTYITVASQIGGGGGGNGLGGAIGVKGFSSTGNVCNGINDNLDIIRYLGSIKNGYYLYTQNSNITSPYTNLDFPTNIPNNYGNSGNGQTAVAVANPGSSGFVRIYFIF